MISVREFQRVRWVMVKAPSPKVRCFVLVMRGEKVGVSRAESPSWSGSR